MRAHILTKIQGCLDWHTNFPHYIMTLNRFLKFALESSLKSLTISSEDFFFFFRNLGT